MREVKGRLCESGLSVFLSIVLVMGAVGNAAEAPRAEGVKIGLCLKIQEEEGKGPLEGAHVQYMGRMLQWYDFGCPLETRGGEKLGSKGDLSALGEDAGDLKGREANYSIEGPVAPKLNPTCFRVLKQGYEPFHFGVKEPREGQRYYREITLRKHGMVACWPCNEGAGDVAGERTGKAAPGKMVGATWVKDGPVTAMKFDGQDDVVDCGRSPVYEQEEAITVLLWVKPEEKTSYPQGLMGRAWRDPYFFSSRDDGLTAGVYLKDFGWLEVTQPDVLKTGEWNLVGFSFGDSRLKVFHNGWNVGEDTAQVSTSEVRKEWAQSLPWMRYNLIDVPTRSRLSCGYFDGVGYFKGFIRDVRMYNYALSEREVAEIYATDNLVGPAITGVTAVGDNTRVVLTFSELLDKKSASLARNYSLDNGVAVKEAALSEDLGTVVLQTSPLVEGVAYTATIKDIKDIAGNVCEAGKIFTFKYCQPQPGLRYAYYEQTPTGDDLSCYEKMEPKGTGVAEKVDRSMCKRDSSSVRFDGLIRIPRGGEYTFYAGGACRLYIGKRAVVRNDRFFDISNRQRHGIPAKIELAEGMHPVTITSFGGKELKVVWEGPEIKEQEIPAEALWH